MQKTYFIETFTHGQPDYFIQYIDPYYRAVRNNLPDVVLRRDEPS